jgi:hypothetical protein
MASKKQRTFAKAVGFLTKNLADARSTVLADPDALYSIARAIKIDHINPSLCDTAAFASLLGDLLQFFYETRADLDITCQSGNLEAMAEMGSKTPAQIKIHAFACCLFVTHQLLDRFASFSVKYAQTAGLTAHLDFLDDERFCAQRIVLWNEQLPVPMFEYFESNVSALHTTTHLIQRAVAFLTHKNLFVILYGTRRGCSDRRIVQVQYAL